MISSQKEQTMNIGILVSILFILLMATTAFAEQKHGDENKPLMVVDNSKAVNTQLKNVNSHKMSTAHTCSAKTTNNKSSDVKHGTTICLTINGKSISATLNNSETAKDFISMLPISLKLEDYAKVEKISYLPTKLSINGAPSGYAPSVGDITYYAPWGNLAIFYQKSTVGFARGLISLGKIDGDINPLVGADGATLTIEKIE
jgi:hypothetical protein